MQKADLHIHSAASDGTYTHKVLIEHLVEAGISVAAITDHDTILGAKQIKAFVQAQALPIEIILGEEVTSSQGHIVGLFLTERINPGKSAFDTVAAIHKQEGLAILAHPERHVSRKESIELLDTVPFDGLEVGGLFDYREEYVKHWHNLNQKRWKLAEIGSTDSHTIHFFGRAYTEFPGSKAQDLYQAVKRKLTHPVYYPFTGWEKWKIRFTYASRTPPRYLLGGALEVLVDLFKGRL